MIDFPEIVILVRGLGHPAMKTTITNNTGVLKKENRMRLDTTTPHAVNIIKAY